MRTSHAYQGVKGTNHQIRSRFAPEIQESREDQAQGFLRLWRREGRTGKPLAFSHEALRAAMLLGQRAYTALTSTSNQSLRRKPEPRSLGSWIRTVSSCLPSNGTPPQRKAAGQRADGGSDGE